MILAIDIGNTLTKIAVFDQDEMLQVEQYRQVDFSIINKFLTEYPFTKTIISSVKKEGEGDWQSRLADYVPLVYFNVRMTGKITNHYQTPETLGTDRLASVIGAYHLYPARQTLVINGGTCITYDWIDSEGNYYGGSISPGLQMRFQALNHYTASLPVIQASAHFEDPFGNDTISSVRSGVQNGIKYELVGFIENYQTGNQEPNIILSGGDSIFFDTLLKNSIFAPYIKKEPYLVLKGLNVAIHNHND